MRPLAPLVYVIRLALCLAVGLGGVSYGQDKPPAKVPNPAPTKPVPEGKETGLTESLTEANAALLAAGHPPIIALGDTKSEKVQLELIDQMTGPKLVAFLKNEPRQSHGVRSAIRKELYVGRMKHRALERVGELKHLPAVPYLIRDLDYQFPPAGAPFFDFVWRLSQEFRNRPACDALIKIGRPALPELIAARDAGDKVSPHPCDDESREWLRRNLYRSAIDKISRLPEAPPKPGGGS